MTSGTDDPRPAGEPPADSGSRPESRSAADSDPPSTGHAASQPTSSGATQPWGPDPDSPRDAVRDTGQQPSADGDAPEPEADPIRPVPGGGWRYASHGEDPARAESASTTPAGGPDPRATPQPMNQPAGRPVTQPTTESVTRPQPTGPASGSGAPAAAAAGSAAAPRPTYGGSGPGPTARQSAPAPARQPTANRPPAPARKGPRRARLTVRRIDPWSVLKFSFVYSLAGVVVLLVAAIVLYLIVDAMGVIDSVRSFLNDVEGGNSGLSQWLGFGRVMTVAIVLGIVNVVLFTAFATLTAFVYNVCTEIVGGVEVTLTDSAGAGNAEVASSGGRGL